MIGWLSGQVLEIVGSIVVLDVAGVGYEVTCSRRCLADLVPGERASITIFTQVREDDIRLYGFADRLEKQVFALLMEVKGIGAKTACEILAQLEKVELLRVIGRSDTSKLAALKGIGKKTAERIVLELREKVNEFISGKVISGVEIAGPEGASSQDALDALQALGFSRRDAERALEEVRKLHGVIAGYSTGDLVREALQYV